MGLCEVQRLDKSSDTKTVSKPESGQIPRDDEGMPVLAIWRVKRRRVKLSTKPNCKENNLRFNLAGIVLEESSQNMELNYSVVTKHLEEQEPHLFKQSSTSFKSIVHWTHNLTVKIHSFHNICWVPTMCTHYRHSSQQDRLNLFPGEGYSLARDDKTLNNAPGNAVVKCRVPYDQITGSFWLCLRGWAAKKAFPERVCVCVCVCMCPLGHDLSKGTSSQYEHFRFCSVSILGEKVAIIELQKQKYIWKVQGLNKFIFVLKGTLAI